MAIKTKILTVFITFLCIVLLKDVNYIDASEAKINLDQVLFNAGYIKLQNPYIPTYSKSNPNITLTFDFAAGKVRKNEFIFDITNKFEMRNGDVYINISSLESIINRRIIASSAEVVPIEFGTHDWVNMSNSLIAHAAGGIIEIDGSNSYEALVLNYHLGHRIFEIDLNLTTDENLVAVHSWDGYAGGMKSTEEWANVMIAGVFRTMSLDDILTIMSVNEDMFLVTDTKSFDYTDEETILQFKIIVDQAKKYGDSVLNRIIPQIYNQEMYSMIMDIHPFRSVIYTLYASPDTNDQVVEFVRDKENIKVITMGAVRYSDDFYNALTEIDKYIYFFTLNDIEDIETAISKGVKGFYTDFIVPANIQDLKSK